MKKLVLFAVAVVMAGCGQNGTPRTNGDAAAAGTGGMGEGGNAGATGAAGGGGTNIAGSTATSGGIGGGANGSGGAILPGGSSGSSGGTGGGTTASGGMSTNGGASINGGASTSGGMSTDGGTSASSGLSVTTGGEVAQSGGTTGQTTIATGGAGGRAGNGGSSSQTGGATNQAGASSCSAPDCCVPIALNPSRVDVYQVDGVVIVNLVVEPSDPANIDINGLWAPYAEITTSWGGTQTCTGERRFTASWSFVTLRCPAAVPSTALTCGSPASVQVRLRADSYSGTEPYGLVCAGSDTGPSTTITAAVKCPTCPSSADFFGYQPCDYPDPPSGTSITQCRFFLPCTCTVNNSTGVKTWSCPQP